MFKKSKSIDELRYLAKIDDETYEIFCSCNCGERFTMMIWKPDDISQAELYIEGEANPPDLESGNIFNRIKERIKYAIKLLTGQEIKYNMGIMVNKTNLRSLIFALQELENILEKTK